MKSKRRGRFFPNDVDVGVSGEIPSLRPVSTRPTAGLIVAGTGEWAWICRSLGMVVSWVWAERAEWLPEWLRIELPEVVMTNNREVLTKVNVILCERRPPS